VHISLLAVAGVLGATGALAYLYPPGLRRRLRSPERVPGAESLPPGGSSAVRIAGEPALLLKTESGYRAFSLVCTHLGCVVRWRPDEARKKNSQKKIAGRFACPCHGGVFDSEGQVVSGPPPRALERLEVRERNGQVFII
jgi:cytochrome b6-f complex iron-sulfur subunit